MSRRVMCGECGGNGYRDQLDIETCSSCVGTGVDLKEDLWAGPCRAPGCNGGKVTVSRRITCLRCGGTGYEGY